MKNRKLNIFILFIALFLFACNKSYKVISEDKMQLILHDKYLAEALYEIRYTDFESNDKKEKIYTEILKKYNVTRADFDSSLVWYSDHPDLFTKINDSVESFLQQNLEDVELRYNIKLNDIANLKILNSYSFLSKNNPILRFDLDSNYISKHPNFSLNFTTLGFKNFDVDFVVNYIFSDTIVQDTQKIITDMSYESSLERLNIKKDLKSVNGYIYINNLKSELALTPLLYNIKLK